MSTVQSPDQEPSVGELVRRASENMSTLVRGEIDLAKAELSTTVKRAGTGGGMLAAAAVLLLFSVPFLFVVIAEALVALGVPRWVSYLIVWVFFLLVAVVLALLGRRQLRKVRRRSGRCRRSRRPPPGPAIRPRRPRRPRPPRPPRDPRPA